MVILIMVKHSEILISIMFYLWAKYVTRLYKSNKRDGNIFPGDLEYCVSTLLKYGVHIQVKESEKSGTTSVSAVTATLLYYLFSQMLLDPLFFLLKT